MLLHDQGSLQGSVSSQFFMQLVTNPNTGTNFTVSITCH
uniref:Uncharacterized protein n=1 Tax=Rhizophora mucronata TaxID=61149 RepID=A0A2P2Q5I1_RHIMU